MTRASVYNGHLRGPVTLAPIAEHLAVELSLCFYDLGLSRLRFEHATFRLRANALTHCATALYIFKHGIHAKLIHWKACYYSLTLSFLPITLNMSPICVESSTPLYSKKVSSMEFILSESSFSCFARSFRLNRTVLKCLLNLRVKWWNGNSQQKFLSLMVI